MDEGPYTTINLANLNVFLQEMGKQMPAESMVKFFLKNLSLRILDVQVGQVIN